MTAKRKTAKATSKLALNPGVSAMVERELNERPNFSHRILQALAAELDPAVETMDPRLFHAEYVVPAQRRIAAAAGKRRKRKAKRGAGAEAAARRSRRRAQAGETTDQVTAAAPQEQPVEQAEPGAVDTGAREPLVAQEPAAAPEPLEAAAAVTRSPVGMVSQGTAVVERRAPATQRQPERGQPTRREEELMPATSPTPARRAGRASQREDQVRVAREAFFVWARELADAESPAEIVAAFDQLDRIVDRLLRG